MQYRYRIEYRHKNDDDVYVTTRIASTDTKSNAEAIRDALNEQLDELYDALGRHAFEEFYGEAEYFIVPVQVKEVSE